ncbi:MAG: CRISPR-associated protein Csx3 [Proteobacteria bacterium]|nr:CRISPR-associated protein Csx3 [Pseudomonadota bacterium]
MLNVEDLYKETEDSTAKLADLDKYCKKALQIAGEGNEIVITGQGPIWLYLKLAHCLHGKAMKLIYRSPVTGDLTIFDHSPF